MGVAKKIGIIVADDSTIYRNNVCLLIRHQYDMEAVVESGNGWSAILKVKAHKPDNLVIDIRMPFIDGIDATKEMVSKFPDVNVIRSGFTTLDHL